MKAIGMVETKGLVAAVDVADTMLKAANVSLVSKNCIGSGLVTIVIKGDVGACTAAVESGIHSAERFDALVSHHIIARPADELPSIIDPPNPPSVPLNPVSEKRSDSVVDPVPEDVPIKEIVTEQMKLPEIEEKPPVKEIVTERTELPEIEGKPPIKEIVTERTELPEIEGKPPVKEIVTEQTKVLEIEEKTETFKQKTVPTKQSENDENKEGSTGIDFSKYTLAQLKKNALTQTQNPMTVAELKKITKYRLVEEYKERGWSIK